MKAKIIMASVMAFALMVSPVSGMNVSAEEAQAVPAAQAQAANAEQSVSENNSTRSRTLTAPTNVHFTEGTYSMTFDWNGDENCTDGLILFHAQVFKDGELYKEYNSERDFTLGGPYWYEVKNIKPGTFQLPFSQDLEDSGSYYFKVRAEQYYLDRKGRNSLVSASEWVTSETVNYTRPDKALGTTTAYWDENQEGLLHYMSAEDAAGYQFFLFTMKDGNPDQTYFTTIHDPAYFTTIGHLSICSRIVPGAETDAGGEDKTIDLKDYIELRGSGKYVVAVKALSGSPDEIANGELGNKSTVWEIGGEEEGDEDDSESEPVLSPVEAQVSEAKPGDVVAMQNVTALSNSEMKQLLESNVTLEMEYTYEGVNYKVRIPAGKAMDNDIPWYGPLYLAQHYGVSSLSGASRAGASGPSYTVQKGDTLSGIARSNNMTTAELAAKNPQIKDVDKITVGQVLQIK